MRGVNALQGGVHRAGGRGGRVGGGDRVGQHHREHRRLRAYNTDYLAVAKLLADHRVPVDHAFAVLGSGGMAKAVVAALRDAGFGAGTVVARNPRTGAALAERYGYDWRAEVGADRPQLLVNATPVGMSGGPAADALPVAPEVVDAAETVLDVVAVPALTPLVRRARAQGKQVITGAEVIALQAVEQFVLYTGVRPSDDQIRRASEFARA
jgi:shikimate dehydrogenase